MGFLDAVLGKAVPGGNISKPLMIALGALVVGKMVHGSGGKNTQATQASQTTANGNATPDGGLVGGMSGLLQKIEKAGHGETTQSWVGNGPNKPIAPQHLQQALGSKNISQAAQQAGMNEQELLSQLSTALPGLVDKLTANGKIPSLQHAGILNQQK